MKVPSCKECNTEDCFVHCASNSQGTEHEAQPDTLTHNDQDVFDVNCKHCGQSGSLRLQLDPYAINW